MPRFSFIIPVFNRPEELEELLLSIQGQSTLVEEVVVVEDGSSRTAKGVVDRFLSKLPITYIEKPNTGPGDSRNIGMKKASGDYFIVLDSDCILPKNYLEAVKNFLAQDFVDFFGGPDKAHASFSPIQKAIDFSMTSWITTGGIRGKKSQNFEPRSFNMGISRAAFQASGGFGNIHPGEDPDLSIRLKALGFKSKLIKDAFVYHKRRVTLRSFYSQLYKFGMVRTILNRWHPRSKKAVHCLPSLMIFGAIGSFVMWVLGFPLGIYIYAFYLLLIFISALIRLGSLKESLLAVLASVLMFTSYGSGYTYSWFKLIRSKKSAEKLFPQLFFNQ